MTLLQDDRELLAAFREGLRDALERVYRQYVRAVDHYVRVLARATGNPELGQRSAVADLVQEVFAKAFAVNARLAYDGIRDYEPYLMAVTRNCFVDALRARGREVLQNIEELAEGLEGTVEPSEPTCDPRTQAVVAQYLRDLPDPLRAAYEQRFVLCKSQEEAAAALGLSRRSFRTAEERLRRGLRKALVRAGISLRELAASPKEISTRVAASPVFSRSRP